MVNITINNQSIQAPIGTKLLEACNMAGVVVPTLSLIHIYFMATMNAYNQACETGVDQEFFKKPQYLRCLLYTSRCV